MPNDSLLYNWWRNLQLFSYLLVNDSLIAQDTVAENFYNAYLDSVPNRLDSIKYDILGIQTGLWTTGEIEGIANKLNAIATNNTPEQNEKEFLDHLMYIYQGGDIDSRWDDLWTIARQCVFYGGPAVVEARALLISDSAALRYYPWVDSCISPSSKRGFEPEVEPSEEEPAVLADYRLKPNYYLGTYSGSIVIGAEESGDLVIYDLAGRQIVSYTLRPGQNSIQAEFKSQVRHLNAG